MSIIASTTSDDKKRVVGILYSVWHDWFQTSRDRRGQPFVMDTGAPYGPYPTFNWWGRPAICDISSYLFMKDMDPERPNHDLIDAHADMLVAAGVDFIAIDLTNGQQGAIVDAARAVCKRYGERDPEKTPKVVLFVQNRQSVAELWTKFWNPGCYPEHIWFHYNGKPLLLVAQADVAAPQESPFDYFTARHCWGLQGTRNQWSFKENTDWNVPFYAGQLAEEMSVCAAVQATHMTTPEGRRGRDRGLYFHKQWDAVFSQKPKFVLVTAWNEWGSQNYGNEWQPQFTDCFGEEYSACLEPMQGGHEDTYYKKLKAYVACFKGIN